MKKHQKKHFWNFALFTRFNLTISRIMFQQSVHREGPRLRSDWRQGLLRQLRQWPGFHQLRPQGGPVSALQLEREGLSYSILTSINIHNIRRWCQLKCLLIWTVLSPQWGSKNKHPKIEDEKKRFTERSMKLGKNVFLAKSMLQVPSWHFVCLKVRSRLKKKQHGFEQEKQKLFVCFSSKTDPESAQKWEDRDLRQN